MEKIVEEIPWWIKAILLLGGSLMSAFSSKFPDGLQILGLWAELLLAFVGGAALIWHLTNLALAHYQKPKLQFGISHLVLVAALLISVCVNVWQRGETTHAPSPVVATRQINPATGQYFDAVQNEWDRRLAVVRRLRAEYPKSHPDASPGIIAGTEMPPVDWMNQQLLAEKEPWHLAPTNAPTTAAAPRKGTLQDIHISGAQNGIKGPCTELEMSQITMDVSKQGIDCTDTVATPAKNPKK